MSKLNKTLVVIASLTYGGLCFAQAPAGPLSNGAPGQGSSVATDTYAIQGNDGTHIITKPLTQFELDGLQFQQDYSAVRAAEGRIRMDIYTKTGCSPCHDLLAKLNNPGVQDILQERGIKIVVHVDENPGGILGYPTTRISKGGRQVSEIVGDRSIDDLINILKGV